MRRLCLTLISISILLGVTGCSFKVTRPMLKMMMSGSVRTTVASLPCSLGKATMWCCWSTESTTESRTSPMNWPTAHVCGRKRLLEERTRLVHRPPLQGQAVSGDTFAAFFHRQLFRSPFRFYLHPRLHPLSGPSYQVGLRFPGTYGRFHRHRIRRPSRRPCA